MTQGASAKESFWQRVEEELRQIPLAAEVQA